MDNQKIQEHVNDLKVMARQFSPIVGNVLIGAAEALEQQQREIERLTEGWHVIANLPIGEHPSDTRRFGKRMLKGETPYLLQEDTNG